MSVLVHIIQLSFYNGFVTRKKTWLKALGISTIIMLITYLNFFILPYEWNSLVEPYLRAEYDIVIDIGHHFPKLVYVDPSLTQEVYVEMLLSNLTEAGMEITDYVELSEYYLREYGINFIILSNISKLNLTEYNNVVSGDYPDYDEVLIWSMVLSREGITIDRDILKLADGKEFSYSGIYMGQRGDIVLDRGLFETFINETGGDVNLYRSLGYSLLLYIKTDGDVDLNLVINTIFNLVENLNRTGVIRFHESMTRDTLVRSIEYSVVTRSDHVEMYSEYYASEYLNPLSPFMVYSVGGLIVFITYLLKLSIDVVREDMDIVALLYSIGGGDKHIGSYMFFTVSLFVIPPILVAFFGSILWIRAIYGIFLPYTLIFEWLAPYIFIPLVAVLVGSSVLSVLYVRRVGLAHILSLEF